MKIWKMTYHTEDSPSGIVNEYFVAKKEASKRHTAVARNSKGTGFTVHKPVKIDVPTTRRELVNWLNVYAGVR